MNIWGALAGALVGTVVLTTILRAASDALDFKPVVQTRYEPKERKY